MLLILRHHYCGRCDAKFMVALHSCLFDVLACFASIARLSVPVSDQAEIVEAVNILPHNATSYLPGQYLRCKYRIFMIGMFVVSLFMVALHVRR